MVKVTGPAMSLDASGSLAGTLVFSKWKGRPYVRQLVRPSNPQTPGQNFNRAMMKYLSQAWKPLGSVIWATWDVLAASLKVSPFNAYIRTNMRDWQSYLGPLQNSTDARTTTPTGTPTFTATGGIGRATVAIAYNTLAHVAGMVIHRSAGPTTPGDATDVIAIIPFAEMGTADYIDSPLTAGEWTYDVTPFSADGAMGTGTGNQTATVT